MEMKTEREYLVGLGLAKPGRGRFSGEGKAALAKARNEGMTFKSTAPEVKTPRVVKVKADKPKATEAVDPAHVRKWAKDNGVEVSDRGRVPEEIKIKYLAATSKEDRAEAKAPAADSFGQPFMRYDERMMFKGEDSNGDSHTVNGRQACTCGYSLMGHRCETPSALVRTKTGTERINVYPDGIKEK